MQLHKHMNDYGWDNFDLNKHSLQEILDAGHLNRVYADSWTKDSVKNGKMAYCSSICGEESRIDRVYFNRLNSMNRENKWYWPYKKLWWSQKQNK